MKAALRPALPLAIGIALAVMIALAALHSLTFGTATVTAGSHHSVEAAAVGGNTLVAVDAGSASAVRGQGASAELASSTHGHGASEVCSSSDDAEWCSSAANASGVPTITVHAFPGVTVSALVASVPVASLLATEAAERPPSRALLSVIRV
ncbi:hypothetical protein ABIB15_002476 [Marisediminicola sp. UYEF4]|uniref:hypothetical protein n=1 Tax=Marisediminicola sp. UYEF4 TaxID=1756384 RepID=UPI0033994B6C